MGTLSSALSPWLFPLLVDFNKCPIIVSGIVSGIICVQPNNGWIKGHSFSIEITFVMVHENDLE